MKNRTVSRRSTLVSSALGESRAALALACTAALVFAAACGSDSGGSGGGTPDAGNNPIDVRFGDTVLIVVLNPIVNDANSKAVPEPGSVRSGITLTSDDDIVATSDASGIVVLGSLTPGARTITLSGDNLSGTFSVNMGNGELKEIAIAAKETTAEMMVEIDYSSDQIIEVNSGMSNQAVNDALKESDSVVFFAGGTYQGDLDFSGSKVTLFGAGVLGGEVTIDGNVTISGSDSRIRGTQITGNLSIPNSGVGLSFSRVDGSTTSEASNLTLLSNALCGSVTVSGSGSIVLDNAGLAPITGCP